MGAHYTVCDPYAFFFYDLGTRSNSRCTSLPRTRLSIRGCWNAPQCPRCVCWRKIYRRARMHGMDNITLSPETYEIELRRRPIVSTSQLKVQAGLAQTQFATAASTRNVPWVKRFTSAMSALCRLSLRTPGSIAAPRRMSKGANGRYSPGYSIPASASTSSATGSFTTAKTMRELPENRWRQ